MCNCNNTKDRVDQLEIAMATLAAILTSKGWNEEAMEKVTENINKTRKDTRISDCYEGFLEEAKRIRKEMDIK